mgnify:CR=1 FL=1
MNKNIGELIKQKRTENKMTLKDISEATELPSVICPSWNVD